MSEIDRLLAANRNHVDGFTPPGDDARPSRHVAVLTCMDCRVDPRDALGLELGEAHVLRNAGARVTDDVVRSLVLSSKVLGVDEVVVMQHSGCGLYGTSDDALAERTGVVLDYRTIADHGEALRADVDSLAGDERLGAIDHVVGVLYDLTDGSVTEHARWARSG